MPDTALKQWCGALACRVVVSAMLERLSQLSHRTALNEMERLARGALAHARAELV